MMGRSHAIVGLTDFFARIEAAVNGAHWNVHDFVDILLQWHERARQRRALIELDDRMLKDIGVGRADAVHEASKPFWQP